MIQNRAKTVCTIGPSSANPIILEKLFDAGMDVVRFNFSHGEHALFSEWLNSVRTLAEKKERCIAVLQDLQGPRIRVGGDFPKEGVTLKHGEMVTIGYGEYKKGFIPIDFKNLLKDISKGTIIFLVDGVIELEVISVGEKVAKAKVLAGGTVFPRKGVNIPNAKLSISSITEKDRKDLVWGVENDVDYMALSFVRSAEDIKELRSLIRKVKKDSEVKIIAKIEKPEAVADIDAIMREADGIMIARGDLGIEIPAGEIPIVQKKIILKAIEIGKPVITATQMLESMINNPTPTRAEISDVGNAILDGTDAVMLSGETASGAYPIRAVQAMDKIITKIETEVFNPSEYWFDYVYRGEIDRIKKRRGCNSYTDSIGYSACKIALDIGAKCIVAATISGSTAMMIARNRPQTPVVAISPNKKVLNQLALVWGVKPLHVSFSEDIFEWVRKFQGEMKKKGFVKKGDTIVIVSAYPFVDASNYTNLIKIHKVD